MKLFHLSILTPREKIFDNDISSLIIKTTDGEIGFLADRASTIMEILPGMLRIRDEKGTEMKIETDGGVFRLSEGKATILCGTAYFDSEVEEKKRERMAYLEEEKIRQEQSLAEYKLTRAALLKAFDKLKRGKQK